MSIANQKYTIAYPAQANGRKQINNDTTETFDPCLVQANPAETLTLEWSWLLTSDAAGQDGQRLRARWQLK